MKPRQLNVIEPTFQVPPYRYEVLKMTYTDSEGRTIGKQMSPPVGQIEIPEGGCLLEFQTAGGKDVEQPIQLTVEEKLKPLRFKPEQFEQVEDEQVEDEQVEDGQVEDEQVEDEQVEDEQVEDEQVEDEQGTCEDCPEAGCEGCDQTDCDQTDCD